MTTGSKTEVCAFFAGLMATAAAALLLAPWKEQKIRRHYQPYA